MTQKPRDIALIARSVALKVGTSAYSAAITRIDNDDPLYALEAVKAAQTGLDLITRHAVALARTQGATWQEIADALDLNSRQAAEARYGTSSAAGLATATRRKRHPMQCRELG